TEITGLTIDTVAHTVTFPAVHFSVFQSFRASGAAQTAQLPPQDVEDFGSAGSAVAIDGDWAVVGIPGLDGLGANSNSGAVYVWIHNLAGPGWAEQKLHGSNAAAGDEFGGAVAISGDTLAVGAAHESAAQASSGAVYVFTRNPGPWAEQQKLKAATPVAFDD